MSGAARGLEAPPSSTPRRPRLAPLFALLVAFAVGLAGGFVYSHESATPEVSVILTSEPASAEAVLRGTISSVGPDFVEIATSEGVRRLSGPPGAGVEDLVPFNGPVTAGSAVNVGGNRTDSGFVITGVVVVAGAER